MIRKSIYAVAAITVFAFLAAGQTPGLLKRTTFKTDRFEFGAGGTVAVVGTPTGSITIEGWQNSEIEISADIEVQAASEADLAKLAEVTTFVLDETPGRTGIISVGTHDKKTMKAIKKFPKNLFGLPFRIDYHIKVPRYTDLQIDGGSGDLSVSGVEGVFTINYLNANAKIGLLGGVINATFGSGNVDIVIPDRSWRGRTADVQMANGILNVQMPANINADIDASVLRTGKIENAFTEFKPRNRNAKFTDRSVMAKAGTGGIPLKFVVGDGTLRLSQVEMKQ
jgi:hypothetical protein